MGGMARRVGTGGRSPTGTGSLWCGGRRRAGPAAAGGRGRSGGQVMWCDAGFRSLLPEAAWQALLSVGARRTYAAGELLMIEGDETSNVFAIVGGRVKVTCNEENGMEVL